MYEPHIKSQTCSPCIQLKGMEVCHHYPFIHLIGRVHQLEDIFDASTNWLDAFSIYPFTMPLCRQLIFQTILLFFLWLVGALGCAGFRELRCAPAALPLPLLPTLRGCGRVQPQRIGATPVPCTDAHASTSRDTPSRGLNMREFALRRHCLISPTGGRWLCSLYWTCCVTLGAYTLHTRGGFHHSPGF